MTGVEDSAWTYAVGTLVEDGEPVAVEGRLVTRSFLVPTTSLQVTQTWQGVSQVKLRVKGMRPAEE